MKSWRVYISVGGSLRRCPKRWMSASRPFAESAHQDEQSSLYSVRLSSSISSGNFGRRHSRVYTHDQTRISPVLHSMNKKEQIAKFVRGRKRALVKISSSSSPLTSQLMSSIYSEKKNHFRCCDIHDFYASAIIFATVKNCIYHYRFRNSKTCYI